MSYSFAPRGNQWGGSLGGYGSLGMGTGLANSLGVGLNMADSFRRYQNNVYLDPMRLKGQYAGYEADYAKNRYNQIREMASIHDAMKLLKESGIPGPWANGQQQQTQQQAAWQVPMASPMEAQTQQQAAWQIPMGTQTQQDGSVSTGDPSFGNSLLGNPSSQGRAINTEPTLQELLQVMRG